MHFVAATSSAQPLKGMNTDPACSMKLSTCLIMRNPTGAASWCVQPGRQISNFDSDVASGDPGSAFPTQPMDLVRNEHTHASPDRTHSARRRGNNGTHTTTPVNALLGRAPPRALALAKEAGIVPMRDTQHVRVARNSQPPCGPR